MYSAVFGTNEAFKNIDHKHIRKIRIENFAISDQNIIMIFS